MNNCREIAPGCQPGRHTKVNCRSNRLPCRCQSLRIEWMRYALILALAAEVTAPAQGIVNPLRLRSAIAQLETAQPGEQALRCDVSPIRPSLNFSFRYHAGYTVSVPMNQYLGSGHGWSMLTRITPEGGDRKPVYLLSRIPLPKVPKTNVESTV